MTATGANSAVVAASDMSCVITATTAKSASKMSVWLHPLRAPTAASRPGDPRCRSAAWPPPRGMVPAMNVNTTVDRLIRLAGAEAAGEDHGHRAGQGRHFNREEIEPAATTLGRPDPPASGGFPVTARLSPWRGTSSRKAGHVPRAIASSAPCSTSTSPALSWVCTSSWRSHPCFARGSRRWRHTPPEVDLANGAADEVQLRCHHRLQSSSARSSSFPLAVAEPYCDTGAVRPQASAGWR